MFRRLLLVMVALLLVAAAQPFTAEAQGNCANIFPRLADGSQGRVTPGLPNVVRNQPWRGAGSAVIGQIPAGGVFMVLAGYAPQCSDGILWRYVSYNGLFGWTGEGQNGVYWAEPVTNPGGLCSNLQPRLSMGGQGRVTPGLPNVLRSQPWRGAGSTVIGYIPANSSFSVIDGPRCADNITWWYVTYNNLTGWTPEGQANTYWTEPFINAGTCESGLTARLYPGINGRVLPGLPNTLRDNPTTYNRRLGQIPAGGIFSVLSGPYCGQGIIWWQVNYNGVIGYTGEGRYGQYWLEPLW